MVEIFQKEAVSNGLEVTSDSLLFHNYFNEFLWFFQTLVTVAIFCYTVPINLCWLLSTVGTKGGMCVQILGVDVLCSTIHRMGFLENKYLVINGVVHQNVPYIEGIQ